MPEQPLAAPDSPDQEKDKSPEKASGSDTQLEEVIPKEVLDNLPGEVRTEIHQALFRFQSKAIHPLIDKIKDRHMDTIVTGMLDNNKRQFEFVVGQRRYNMAVFLIATVIFIFLVVFLQDKPTILAPTLTALLGFAGGFGLGKKV